jgi:hypothetical protein
MTSHDIRRAVSCPLLAALVAYSGWSCGGLQALQVAKDSRVKTMVLHSTGVLNDGPGAIPGMDVRKDVLTTLHTPTI